MNSAETKTHENVESAEVLYDALHDLLAVRLLWDVSPGNQNLRKVHPYSHWLSCEHMSLNFGYGMTNGISWMKALTSSGFPPMRFLVSSRFAASRPISATFAPFWTKSSAITRPNPEPAPVNCDQLYELASYFTLVIFTIIFVNFMGLHDKVALV